MFVCEKETHYVRKTERQKDRNEIQRERLRGRKEKDRQRGGREERKFKIMSTEKER